MKTVYLLPLLAVTASCGTMGTHLGSQGCPARIRATSTLEQVLSVLVENYHVPAANAKAIAEELMTGEESPEETCKAVNG